MNILVTGANGFIGKNLIIELKNRGYDSIFEYDLNSKPEALSDYTRKCDFVFHLAGINRPDNPEDFLKGNFGFTSLLLDQLKKHKNNCPIMISSSIQAELNNPYGISKKAGEELMFAYAKDTGAKVLVYRFPNVFGKWCRPNYNSVVATFAYNIANDLPITINDPSVELSLIYIDDLVNELINSLSGHEHKIGSYCFVEPVYKVTLGEIAKSLQTFKDNRENRNLPHVDDSFTKKLYSTYLSYLPRDKFGYDLKMNVDQRGSFTEFLKTTTFGQVSVNVAKPGFVKGNHYHHTKVEKFLVVSGEAIIRFRKVDETEIIEYRVSGEKLQVIDIPPGYTHNIENVGKIDLVTIMWANELFDQEKPDTYFVEV